MTIRNLVAVSIVLTATSLWLSSSSVAVAQETVLGDEVITLKGDYDVMILFVSPWSVTERHLDSAGNITATVKGHEEITWQLDQRAMQRAYTRPGQSTTYRALGLLTYNEATKKFEGTWVNNASTNGPTTVSGSWNAEEMTMTFTLSQKDDQGQDKVMYKVVERFVDAKQREAITYQIDGPSVKKIMEVQYSRLKPCPAKIRGLYTG